MNTNVWTPASAHGTRVAHYGHAQQTPPRHSARTEGPRDQRHECTDEPMMPGVNGVKAFRGRAYFTSTERALILRAAVCPNGDAGALEVVAERFVGDDFAFDVDGNLYVATHIYNQLQRLAPGGERTVLAGADEGMHGSTAVAFGRGPSDRDSLYVTTTGGIIAPSDGTVREARLIRLDVGIAGAPLGM